MLLGRHSGQDGCHVVLGWRLRLHHLWLGRCLRHHGRPPRLQRPPVRIHHHLRLRGRLAISCWCLLHGLGWWSAVLARLGSPVLAGWWPTCHHDWRPLRHGRWPRSRLVGWWGTTHVGWGWPRPWWPGRPWPGHGCALRRGWRLDHAQQDLRLEQRLGELRVGDEDVARLRGRRGDHGAHLLHEVVQLLRAHAAQHRVHVLLGGPRAGRAAQHGRHGGRGRGGGGGAHGLAAWAPSRFSEVRGWRPPPALPVPVVTLHVVLRKVDAQLPAADLALVDVLHSNLCCSLLVVLAEPIALELPCLLVCD
mmetsp:Transcript_22965/g.58711  ORF Transcript_22965/g.58711 Transcript_22965/m.58711 type:complete len:306 (-) Transcript_22965:177-1094(-)